MENKNLNQVGQVRNNNIPSIVILAVLSLPLAIPLFFALVSVIFAGGVTLITLLGTGFMLLIKSFGFLASLEFIFFTKAFLGGLSLIAICTLPIVIILLVVKLALKNR